MKLYYLIQLGKHSARFFIHVFIRAEGNFMEFTLHHGITVFLVGYSYLTNMWLIGLMVFFLHDYSDFALALARLYRVTYLLLSNTNTKTKNYLESSTCMLSSSGFLSEFSYLYLRVYYRRSMPPWMGSISMLLNYR